MLTKATIENLTPEDFKLVNEEDVLNPDLITRVEELTTDGEIDYESGEAGIFLETLKKIVEKHNSVLKSQPTIYERYTKTLQKVQWESLSTLRPEERDILLAEHILSSLTYDIDVLGLIKKMFVIFEYGTYPDSKRRQRFVRAIEKNQEQLSNIKLLLTSREQVEPTVQNWLRDYNENLRFNSGNRALADEYIATNENVKKLDERQRQLLRRTIEIFNWLKYPQLSGDFVNIEDMEGKVTPETQSTKQVYIPRKARAATQPPKRTVQQPETFDASRVREKIFQLAQRHKLRVDESSEFENEVLRAFNGVTHPDEFINRLRIGLPTIKEEKLEALVVDTNHEIFEPARKILLKHHIQDEESEPIEDDSIETTKQKLEGRITTQAEEKTVAKQPVHTDPYREPIE